MGTKQSIVVTIFTYVILITVSLIVVGPVLVIILGSIRTTGEFLSSPFGLPQSGLHWENYTSILEGSSFWGFLKNSLIITFGTAFLNITLSSLLAFVFSRVKFLGRTLAFNVLSIGLLIPLVVAVLPIFIQIRQLGLMNSVLGVILPLTAFGLPGSVVILRSFFIHIPIELEEAAYLDGTSRFGFFWYILMPLARPAVTAIAVLQIVYSWNEYLLPLLVLNKDDAWPLPLGIQQFQGQYGTDWSRLMAYVSLLVIPAMIFYLFVQKYIVTGLTGGELKG